MISVFVFAVAVACWVPIFLRATSSLLVTALDTYCRDPTIPCTLLMPFVTKVLLVSSGLSIFLFGP